MRNYLVLLLLAALCIGCNDAAARQRANQAQRAAEAKKLKQLGQAMHAQQANESTVAPASSEAQPKAE